MEGWISEILSFVAGLLAGFVIKVRIDKRRIDSSATNTIQRRNTVGGHQAGRDVSVGGDDA